LRVPDRGGITINRVRALAVLARSFFAVHLDDFERELVGRRRFYFRRNGVGHHRSGCGCNGVRIRCWNSQRETKTCRGNRNRLEQKVAGKFFHGNKAFEFRHVRFHCRTINGQHRAIVKRKTLTHTGELIFKPAIPSSPPQSLQQLRVNPAEAAVAEHIYAWGGTVGGLRRERRNSR